MPPVRRLRTGRDVSSLARCHAACRTLGAQAVVGARDCLNSDAACRCACASCFEDQMGGGGSACLPRWRCPSSGTSTGTLMHLGTAVHGAWQTDLSFGSLISRAHAAGASMRPRPSGTCASRARRRGTCWARRPHPTWSALARRTASSRRSWAPPAPGCPSPASGRCGRRCLDCNGKTCTFMDELK